MGSTTSKTHDIPRSAYNNMQATMHHTHMTTRQNCAATTGHYPTTTTQQQRAATTGHYPTTTTQQQRAATTGYYPTTTTQQQHAATTGHYPTTTTQQQRAATTGHYPTTTTQQQHDARTEQRHSSTKQHNALSTIGSNHNYFKTDNLTAKVYSFPSNIPNGSVPNHNVAEIESRIFTSPVPIRTKTNLKSIVKPPNKLNDLDDFLRNWNVWKEQLTSFLTITDENKLKYHEWGSYFLHFMGPFGQQILNDLFFAKEVDKKDYLILMQKYNAFYKYSTTVKSDGESIIEYIKKLKGEVVQNFKNVDKTLKTKIAKEIEKLYKERFIALARSKLPNFKFETTFNSLTLAEIAFLWNICEESNFNSNKSCICCGKFHEEGKCPAFGKECNKCRRRNHFSKHCPGLMHIINCGFCGGNHEFRRCLAYGETCSKCGKLHHFSWKCGKEVLLKNCRFCGLSHMMNRSICPAKNSLCSLCKQRGHYDTKCNENQDVQQKKFNMKNLDRLNCT